MDMEPCLPFEDISLEGLSQPLKGRTRIQYTCFTVSNRFIMIGANTGGVYVFNRTSRQFVSILPGQAGGVTCLAVDGAEQLVAAGSLQGAVSVYACPTAGSWSGRLVALARLEAEVRALCWRHAHCSDRLLYVGTAAGKVLAISVTEKRSPPSSAAITPMLQLDSAVCELVLVGETLLASTLGFCYLCNIQMEVFAQVGTQPRPSRLGACFLDGTVFCARPGLRLWEVRLNGQIVSTHQLRPALDEATPRRLVSVCDQAACLQDGGSGGSKLTLALVKLVPLSGGAVAAFSGDAVFLLQLAARRVSLWTSVHGKVLDLSAVGDELYVQCEGGALRRLLIRRPSQIVRELRASRGAAECARFLMSYGELSELCRTRLPLRVLEEAMREFADDAPMQAELTRLAAVLRDRLAESGVSLGEDRESSTPAEDRQQSRPVTAGGRRMGCVRPAATGDGRVEREISQPANPSESGDRRECLTKTDNAVIEVETRDTSMTKEQGPAQDMRPPTVATDESSVDSVVADSSSGEFRTAPSSDESVSPLPTRSAQAAASSDDAAVFWSNRQRRPRTQERALERGADRSPGPHPAESHSPRRPMGSVSPVRSQLQVLPQTPSPPPVEWHDSPGGDTQYPVPPAASQLGVYGYTPGLALHPEVLDAFSDLVGDVRGAVSSGAQRLVQRLRRQQSSPTSAASAATAAAAAAAGDSTEGSEHEQIRETSETGWCAVPADDRQSVAAAAAERAEPGLAELTAAADSADLSLPAVLRWLDAVAATHCGVQLPRTAGAAGADSETEGGGAGHPGLRQLCAEPDAFVCERSLLAPTALRERVSRLLGRTLLFLFCDGEVREELMECTVAAAPAEDAATVSRDDSGVATGGSGDISRANGRTSVTATPVEREGKINSGQEEAASENKTVGGSNTVNEITRGTEFAMHGKKHMLSIMENFEVTTNFKHGAAELSEGQGSGVSTALSESKAMAYHAEEGQSNAMAAEDLTVTAKYAEIGPTATPGHGMTDTKSDCLNGAGRPPAAGSPAWLAEILTRRLFYLVGAGELGARLRPLPAGPRARLWHLLLDGTETRLGPLSVRPGDVSAAPEPAADAELSWPSLVRRSVGLCRVDPAASAAFCLQHSDRLSPLDALYVCRRAAASGHVADAFTAYLTAAGAAAADPLLEDAELAAAAELALTAVWRRQAALLRCRCGWPRPGAHRAARPAATLLRRLLAARLTGHQLSRELWKLGDFSGWLKTGGFSAAVVESDSDWDSELAAVVCQLNDSALLPAAAPLLAGWHSLVAALLAVQPGRCSGCGGGLLPAGGSSRRTVVGRPLTLGALLAFVSSQRGAEAALQLLQAASDVSPRQPTARCYRDIILSTILNRRAAGLGAALGIEMLHMKPPPVPDDAVELLLSELGRPAPPGLPSAGRPGVSAASVSADCAACCLPLLNRHLLRPLGLVTFGCRHAFHASCLLSRAAAGCLLCRRRQPAGPSAAAADRGPVYWPSERLVNS